MFYIRYILEFLSNFTQIFQREFGICDFPPSKADGYTDLHTILQPTARVPDLKTTMMFTGFWAQANFFDLNFGLRFTRFAFLFLFFVKELAIVDKLTNRGVSIGGDFDQIETYCVCPVQGFADTYDTSVFPVFIDQTNSLCANAFIDTVFGSITNLLFSLICLIN